MAGLELDKLFLEISSFVENNCYPCTVMPDNVFDNEIKYCCEKLIMRINDETKELKSQEEALKKAQALFNEKIKHINERLLQYRKSLDDDYNRKCKILDEKQVKLDCMREELERKIERKSTFVKENGTSAIKNSEIQSIVELNVGGNRFTTSLNTLCKDRNSMIAIMFSGRHNLIHSEDGSYFIDRDGTHFQYILNYLRGGIILPADLPEDPFLLNALRREADFYQIRGFTELLDECLENRTEKVDYTQEEIMNMMSPITCDHHNSLLESTENSESNNRDTSFGRTPIVNQNMTKCKLNFNSKKLNGISFAHTTFFHDVSFRNTHLVGASFYGCEFGVGVQINFNYADLTDCDFRQCKGKENGAKMNFAHGGGLLSASSSETFLQMIQEGRISFKKTKIENTLFDPKVADFLNFNRK